MTMPGVGPWLPIAAFALGIPACSPDSSPPPTAEPIPKTLTLQELGELDSRAVSSTRYTLRPAGRSRLGGDAVAVSTVLVNESDEVVRDPICYLFYDARNIRLIEFEDPSEIAPGGRARFEGIAHFERDLKGESENIVCRVPTLVRS